MTAANDLAVRRALEAAGVEFIDENGGGPGVRLRNGKGKKPSRAFAQIKARACPNEEARAIPLGGGSVDHIRTISRGSHAWGKIEEVHRHGLGKKLAAQEQVPVQSHSPTSWPKMASWKRSQKPKSKNRTPERFGTAAPHSSSSSQTHTRREKPLGGRLPERKIRHENAQPRFEYNSHLFSGSYLSLRIRAIKKPGTMKNSEPLGRPETRNNP